MRQSLGNRGRLGRILALSLFSLTFGCGEDEVVQGVEAPATNRRTKAAETATDTKRDLPPPVDFQESSFTESDRSRDPFRSFAKVFVEESRSQVKSQREVVLEQYSIDELKLVGIVTGMNPERAMLIDPTGLGHVVLRGQYIGRATVVQPSGGVGAAYEVNWRVDRIRDGDMVLVRDDPANPEIPAATRVVPMRSGDLDSETATGEAEDPSSELAKLKERLAAMEAAEAANERKEKR